MDICDPIPDDEYWLGPFHDLDGMEIVPCATEETDRAIETCIGNYRLCSNVQSLHGTVISINGRIMTGFIQHDWNRLMEDMKRQAEEGQPPSYSVGFLVSYQGLRRAVGRLAEDVVCAELLKINFLEGDDIEKIYSVDDAIDAGLFSSSGAGIRCDDLVLVSQKGRKYLGEVKASLTGRSYLRTSIPKALKQFRNSLAANSDINGVILMLVSIRDGDKFVVLIVCPREDVIEQTDSYWLALYSSLVLPSLKRPTALNMN